LSNRSHLVEPAEPPANPTHRNDGLGGGKSCRC